MVRLADRLRQIADRLTALQAEAEGSAVQLEGASLAVELVELAEVAERREERHRDRIRGLEVDRREFRRGLDELAAAIQLLGA